VGFEPKIQVFNIPWGTSFSLLRSGQTGSGAHPTYCLVVIGGSFPGEGDKEVGIERVGAAVTLLSWEVFGSNLGRETDYPDCFIAVFLSPPSKCWDTNLHWVRTASFHVLSDSWFTSHQTIARRTVSDTDSVVKQTANTYKLKRPGREADNLFPMNAKAKNACSYTSIPYAYSRKWCLVNLAQGSVHAKFWFCNALLTFNAVQ
jgi:hypothetical protein